MEAGHALQQRYNQKMRKYEDLCLAEGIVFEAMPIEVLGGWHESAVRLIKKLGLALSRATGQEEGEVTRHLFGRLSILLMRGNSQLVNTRTPTHPDAQTIGIH